MIFEVFADDIMIDLKKSRGESTGLIKLNFDADAGDILGHFQAEDILPHIDREHFLDKIGKEFAMEYFGITVG